MDHQDYAASPKETRKRQVKALTVVAFVLLGAVILAATIYLNVRHFYLYKKLYTLIKNYIDHLTPARYLVLALINFALQLLFVPGYLFFVLFLGHITDDFWQAMFIYYPPCCAIKVVAFYVSKHAFRARLTRMLSQNWYFHLYQAEAREHPWRVSSTLRVLFIPITLKNYLIPLLDIPFLPYIVPAVVHSFFYAGLFVVLGMNGYLMERFFDATHLRQNAAKTRPYLVTLALLKGLSGLILLGIIAFTVVKFRQYKKASLGLPPAIDAPLPPSGPDQPATDALFPPSGPDQPATLSN